MGLHLVKLYVVRLDGQVAVQSRLGEGTTVTIRLPLATPDNRSTND
jgi:chemotaxis protein histidine kinase CheA